MNLCKICRGNTSKIFDASVLQKYTVGYFQCQSCQFIQTEKPYWLPQAYQSAMTALDVGLIWRNQEFSKLVPPILELFSQGDSSYIDYGGGYGIFVRMMRDLGFDFYLYDIYADNLYAKYFELKNYTSENKFACLTAFEVFEHLENPVDEIQEMFKLSDTLIFSTELQPDKRFTAPDDWWYFVPEVGQHIALYSKRSLEALSQRFECHLYTNGRNLHILTNRKLDKNPFSFEAAVPSKKSFLQKVADKLTVNSSPSFETKSVNRESLLLKDFEYYKKKLKSS